MLALPKGHKPMRTTVDFGDYGSEAIDAVAAAQTARVFNIMEMDHLLSVAR